MNAATWSEKVGSCCALRKEQSEPGHSTSGRFSVECCPMAAAATPILGIGEDELAARSAEMRYQDVKQDRLGFEASRGTYVQPQRI